MSRAAGRRLVAVAIAASLIVAAACSDDGESVSPTTRPEKTSSTTRPSSTSSTVEAEPADSEPDEDRDVRLGEIAYRKSDQIWVMDTDGDGQRPVTTDLIAESGPEWSPDGEQLAVVGWRPAEVGAAGIVRDLWVIEVESGEAENLTRLEGPTQVVSFSWAPEGRQLVFDTTEWDLWVVDADGADRRRITEDETVQSHPAWSPDGALIAYCAIPVADGIVAGRDDIWVSDPDGSDAKPLTDGGGACMPAWSPDGTRIAYTRYIGGERGDGHADVWVMTAEGTETFNVTDDPGRFDTSPAWSPSGAHLVYQSAGPVRFRSDSADPGELSNDPAADIRIVPVTGGEPTQLTTSDQTEASPSWRRQAP